MPTSEPVRVEGPVEFIQGRWVLRIPLTVGGQQLIACTRGISKVVGDVLEIELPQNLVRNLGLKEGQHTWVNSDGGSFTFEFEKAPEKYLGIIWSSVILVGASLLALLGAAFGYVTVAGNGTDYLGVLWAWAALTTTATVLFGVAIVRGNKPVRWIAIGLLSLTWLVGQSPVERLILLYSNHFTTAQAANLVGTCLENPSDWQGDYLLPIGNATYLTAKQKGSVYKNFLVKDGFAGPTCPPSAHTILAQLVVSIPNGQWMAFNVDCISPNGVKKGDTIVGIFELATRLIPTPAIKSWRAVPAPARFEMETGVACNSFQ